MPGEAFGITTTIKSVPLEGKHTIAFTVTNQLGRQLRVNAYVELFKDGKELDGIKWIQVVDPNTFDMAPDGSSTVSVRLEVPADLPSDWKAEKTSLQFQLVVRNIDDPDNEHGESVPITLHPAEPKTTTPPPPQNKLWMILAIAGGAVLVAGGIGLAVYFATRPSPPPPPPTLQAGDPCGDEVAGACDKGLTCHFSVNICLPKEPQLGDLCTRLGPACPADAACQDEGGSSICKAKPGALEGCSQEIGCAGALVCGGTRNVCVSAQPQVGEPCDTTSSKCPDNAICQASGTQVCEALQGLFQDCTTSKCLANLVCGTSIKRCVPSAPSTGDYCDPSGPKSCPSNHVCETSTQDKTFRCQRLLGANEVCTAANTLCQTDFYCGATTKRCIKRQPGLGDLCEPSRRLPIKPILDTVLVKPLDPSIVTSPITTSPTTTTTIKSVTTLRALPPDALRATVSALGLCPSGMVCGAETSICVKSAPALGDLCDPTSTASACPELSKCTFNTTTATFICKSTIIIKLPR